jgi:hypothetical protein
MSAYDLPVGFYIDKEAKQALFDWHENYYYN